MAVKLRPYQQAVVDDIAAAWGRVRSVLAVLPTGGGKTVIFSSIMSDHVGACAAVVHRKEIVAQISLSLGRLGLKHRIIAPPSVVRRIRRRHLKFLGKNFVDQNAPAGVVSVQTMTSKSASNDAALQSWLEQVTLCVFDEGHHYVNSGSWARAVHAVDNAKLLFVSATPERADGKGLGAHASGFVEEMVEGPTTKWLIDNGFLTPFKYYAPASDLDVSDVALTASGDFNAQALRQRVVESHLIGDIVQHYKKFAPGQRFIVFSTDVQTASETADALNAEGLRASMLSGMTEAGVRDAELDKFESGALDGLTNVDLFDEGFDVPAVVVCVLARPTQSLAKYLQMVGRALRIMEGKTHAIIIDPVRNWERHGMPDWPRVWSLDNKEKNTRATVSDTVPQRVCTACTQPYEAFYTKCPYCGTAPTPTERREPEHVDGDLLELDVDALAALFAAKEKANQSDEDFQRGLHARNVPGIGHGPAIRRHRAAKYRRDVLHNLVGWWVGMQEGREQSEIFKRFYLRFGVDMITAFTLDSNGTDALIDKIQRGFKYDIV